MIEKMKERDEMFQKLVEKQKTIPLGCDFPSIGKSHPYSAFRTTDNIRRYHIGRDIWVSENEYTGMLNDAKSPSQLAGHIVTLVFTMQELLTSTKTGYKSRKNGPGKIECGKLDEVKLNACEEYYKYWLQNIYIPVTKKDAVNVTSDLNKFNHYCGKMIADLKKPPASTKKATKKKDEKQHNVTVNDESIVEQNEQNGKEMNENREEYEKENETQETSEEKSEDCQHNKADGENQSESEEDEIEGMPKGNIEDFYNNYENHDETRLISNKSGSEYSTDTEENENDLPADPLFIDVNENDTSNKNLYDWSPACSSSKSDCD
ncbi:uncharacterized protein LOC107981809 isoform X1 [Nasonia vitripennis]|uniref:Uncharacterized protein n=1 Tax=Nasonia vitripennis TaxID=7425 RepID=A0A7M7J758_NASVI|nr:uncharacterized protein LOC107981809 isoform X1 [Nasonia vitripennis]